jgi:hypothetical protein
MVKFVLPGAAAVAAPRSRLRPVDQTNRGGVGKVEPDCDRYNFSKMRLSQIV